MRRINDPIALRDCLARLSDGSRLTVAQARLLLAAQGIRSTQKTVEAALRLRQGDRPAPRQKSAAEPPRAKGRAVANPGTQKPSPAPSKQPSAPAKKAVPLKPLDDLPLTPEERAIMERLRRERF
ncbi:MAG: hypothetical protein KatS3mg071_1700 [Meiothermus sp.]|jgi:hypothetical protein|nr:MAG: hypothetical protein KatS3mg071_1700 [Meiothermus sp.]